MDGPAPTLLLGPQDVLGVNLKARRARVLGWVAHSRVKQAWLCLGASGLAAILGVAAFKTLAPVFWFAGLILVVLADRFAFSRLGARCDAGEAPEKMRWLIAWTALQSAYGNALAAIVWFSPDAAGQSVAAIFLCASLASAAVTLRASPVLALAALAPSALYLLGLPLAEYALDGAADAMHLAPLAGAMLLLVWGWRLWGTLLETDNAQAQAEAASISERQAAAAAAAARAETVRRINDELRTPLAALVGAAEFLRRAAGNSQARARIETLTHTAELLKRVLADVSNLDDAAIDAPASADPRELVRGVVTAFRAEARDKNLELFLDIAEETPSSAILDAARVRQILFNLLANAVRYTQHGGVRVTLSGGSSEGRVRLSFAIADTGQGLSRAQLAALMGDKHFGDGARPGLAISKRIANAIGAKIVATSEPGQGSVFTLTIDAEAAMARSAA